MDSIRTLLLARTHTVLLDPDRVASAATRPARDSDVDRFEAELVQLGFVMSLDLAMTIRRFPHQAIEELRTWILDTLGKALGEHRPQVPLFRSLAAVAPADTYTLYTRRVLSWLLTRAEQPCPWCGQRKPVGALEPCGHLVCRSCWDGGTYAGCPICHRRVSSSEPFIAARGDRTEQVQGCDGDLHVIHLAFDVVGAARARFERVIARATPLSKDDRVELETVIDAMGPKTAIWLPARIPVKETMAIAVARLWMVSPDRPSMVRATQGHLRSATDVLRVAAVLMQASPALAEPMRFRSIGRGLRRAVLEALDRLPLEQVVEDMRRHPGLWKRVGERLHPFERAAALPSAALAFAALRETDLAAASFGAAIAARAAALPNVRISDNRLRVTPWAGAVEDALRDGDARAASERLAQRPGELLRRADQLVRVTAARQPAALGDVLDAIARAIPRGSPASLLTLAAHASKRGAPWPRRVFFPRGEVLRAWGAPDRRAPLPSDAIGSIVAGARNELLTRAATRPRFARAILDRGLADLLVPIHLAARTDRHDPASVVLLPLTLDLVAHRPRWIHVRVRDSHAVHDTGYRAVLAHLVRDFADFVGTGARPTLWELACIHAAARANTVYVRNSDNLTLYRRRDHESAAGRLARLLSGEHDGVVPAIPTVDAPAWVALLRDDLALSAASAGYILDARRTSRNGLACGDAADLLTELAAR